MKNNNNMEITLLLSFLSGICARINLVDNSPTLKSNSEWEMIEAEMTYREELYNGNLFY